MQIQIIYRYFTVFGQKRTFVLTISNKRGHEQATNNRAIQVSCATFPVASLKYKTWYELCLRLVLSWLGNDWFEIVVFYSISRCGYFGEAYIYPIHSVYLQPKGKPLDGQLVLASRGRCHVHQSLWEPQDRLLLEGKVNGTRMTVKSVAGRPLCVSKIKFCLELETIWMYILVYIIIPHTTKLFGGWGWGLLVSPYPSVCLSVCPSGQAVCIWIRVHSITSTILTTIFHFWYENNP